MSVEISGARSGQWILLRGEQRWTLCTGEPESATTRIRLDDDTACRLLFNALPAHDAGRVIEVEGRTELARPFLNARSVIV